MKPGKTESRVSDIPRSRRWIYWTLALLLPSVIFFVLLETGLRIAHYGYPSSFFVQVNGRTDYKPNEEFGRLFFPPALVRTPLPHLLRDPKPQQTYRIFLLGGSAAQGFPDARYGVGRILEAMLGSSYPETDFEVVNTAMTAINSHVVLPISRDCASFEPDLFVLYLGNNEVVGPYGASAVLGGASPSLPILRAGIRAKGFKTGQLLSDGVRRLRSNGQMPSGWRGMEMFLTDRIAVDDPRLERVYDQFAQNLRDICAVAWDTDARVILSTVAVNLRDNPPFASMHRPDLTETERSHWISLYEAGAEQQDSGEMGKALVNFEKAARIDDRFADLHFRMAACHWDQGQFAAARSHYGQARRYDALRFRANEQINGIIRSVSKEQSDHDLYLVDAAAAFSDTVRSHGIPGAEYFWDHVHFNWQGNYLLARLFFEQIRDLLPEAILAGGENNPEPPPIERCAELLTLTIADEHRVAKKVTAMMNLAPFSGQIGFASHQESRSQRVAQLSKALTPRAMQQVTDAYSGAVASAPEDLLLRENLARHLQQAGDYKGAITHWRALIERLPGVTEWITGLGLALADDGRFAEALEIFRDQLRSNSSSVDAHNNIGLTLAKSGLVDEAVDHFQQAIKLDPESAEPHSNLGTAWRVKGRYAEALEEYRLALTSEPTFIDAQMGIAGIYHQQGRTRAAAEQYRDILRIDPRAMGAIMGLADLLSATGRAEDAAYHLKLAAGANPESAILQYRLAMTRGNLGQVDEAMNTDLGNLLVDEDSDEEMAAFHLKRALELRRDWPPALDGLARLLATTDNREIRDPEEAIGLAELACRLTQQRNPIFLQTAALAHIAAGQSDRAGPLAQAAWNIARSAGDSALVIEIEAELGHYIQAKHP